MQRILGRAEVLTIERRHDEVADLLDGWASAVNRVCAQGVPLDEVIPPPEEPPAEPPPGG